MKRQYCFLGLLLIASMALSGCTSSPFASPMKSTETYPTPMPADLPVGIDRGLITPAWDGGYPLRVFAFLLYPVGLAADLLVNQPFYLLGSQYEDVFGYTVQDEVYRNTEMTYRYHWKIPERE